MKRIIVIALGAIALAACGGGPTGTPPPPNAPSSAAPAAAVSPSRVDPGLSGCRALQALGWGASLDGYRAAAAQIAGTGDAQLAAAAVTLHEATGTTLQPVESRDDRLRMFDALLDLLEECLRVTG